MYDIGTHGHSQIHLHTDQIWLIVGYPTARQHNGAYASGALPQRIADPFMDRRFPKQGTRGHSLEESHSLVCYLHMFLNVRSRDGRPPRPPIQNSACFA